MLYMRPREALRISFRTVPQPSENIASIYTWALRGLNTMTRSLAIEYAKEGTLAKAASAGQLVAPYKTD